LLTIRARAKTERFYAEAWQGGRLAGRQKSAKILAWKALLKSSEKKLDNHLVLCSTTSVVSYS
jgi:hypothetical protein